MQSSSRARIFNPALIGASPITDAIQLQIAECKLQIYSLLRAVLIDEMEIDESSLAS